MPALLAAELEVYKVERVLHLRPDAYAEIPDGLTGPYAQIELSASVINKSAVSLPARESFSPLVIIGSLGVADKAVLVEFEKRCEFLCGDEIEECHHTAILDYGNAAVGTPLLALGGVGATVTGFAVLDQINRGALESLAKVSGALAWPPLNSLDLEVVGGEARFTERHHGRVPYAYDATAPQCTSASYPGTDLSRLSCRNAEFLLADGRPLLLSSADYNISAVRPINRYLIAGREHYTVMLALKAYTAYGVLTKVDGHWRFFVRPGTWARLC